MSADSGAAAEGFAVSRHTPEPEQQPDPKAEESSHDDESG